MDLIIDASSVINLDNGHALELVTLLRTCAISVSPRVVQESSPTCALTLLRLQSEGRLQFLDTAQVPAETFLDLLLQFDLGEGETECMAVAHSSAHVICCDDRKARRAAISLLGTKRVVGSLRLLRWCVEEGLLDASQAFDVYERMKAAGGFLPTVDLQWFTP